MAEARPDTVASGKDNPSAVSYGQRLKHLSEINPDGVALVVVAGDGTEVARSWTELDESANRWGRMLTRRGATLGSFVALAIPNSLEFVSAALGSWKIGAIPVPMRWDLPEWERERLLEVVEPAVLLDESVRRHLSEEAERESGAALPRAVSPSVFGICSSGSTGLPKVILNTAPSLWNDLLGMAFLEKWTEVKSYPQTVLVPGPMYHANGFQTLHSLLAGDRLVVLEKFSASGGLAAISRHGVTTFTATPTMLTRMADVAEAEASDLSSIEWMLQGAAAMPETTLRRWFSLLSPEQIVMAYGMTEGLGLTAIRGDEWLSHPGSVGKGVRDTEIRILNEVGERLPVGEVGEIYLRSPMREGYRYIGGAPLLATASDEFRSAGDLGSLDEDGYLYIADRRVDLIISGGANVYPSEVEAALIGHPDIVDVVVIGLADADWGRRVHALVQTAPGRVRLTEQVVIGFAKSRLAPYKVPKTVEFVDEISRSAATKLNRAALVDARGG